MCTVSMVLDHYNDKWKDDMVLTTVSWPPQPPLTALPTREEFEALKRDVEEMKALLKRAKQYDIDHNEPDCELAEKKNKVRKICELVGVDISDIFSDS